MLTSQMDSSRCSFPHYSNTEAFFAQLSKNAWDIILQSLSVSNKISGCLLLTFHHAKPPGLSIVSNQSVCFNSLQLTSWSTSLKLCRVGNILQFLWTGLLVGLISHVKLSCLYVKNEIILFTSSTAAPLHDLWATVITVFFNIPQNPELIITLKLKTTFLYSFPSCEDRNMGECQPSRFPVSSV